MSSVPCSSSASAPAVCLDILDISIVEACLGCQGVLPAGMTFGRSRPSNPIMMSLAFDLRDALRGPRRVTAYALTVVLTLAPPIGATTAVFSIVNGVLLKPLAYRESQQLVELREL